MSEAAGDYGRFKVGRDCGRLHEARRRLREVKRGEGRLREIKLGGEIVGDRTRWWEVFYNTISCLLNYTTYLIVDTRGLVLNLDDACHHGHGGRLDHVGEELLDASHRLHLETRHMELGMRGGRWEVGMRRRARGGDAHGQQEGR